MTELSLYEKYTVARVFILFWTVKRKALEIGRIKSCRATKDMKIPDPKGIDQQFSKFSQKIYKEHYSNLKHMFEESGLSKETQWVDAVVPEPRRGRFRVQCNASQSQKNQVLRLITSSSNLAIEEARKHFLLADGSASFNYYFNTGRRNILNTESVKSDYDNMAAFVQNFKNTMQLVDIVSGKVPEDYKYQYYPRGLRIEFEGISESSFSARDVLKARVKILGIDEPEIRTPAPVSPAADTRTPQQRLNDYVQSVILARR